MKKTLVNIKKIKNRQEIFCEDTVALETEYSLFVNGQKLVRLSCTPEDLKELALGRLYTEGLVRNIRQIRSIQIQEEERTIYVEISENEKQRTEKESGKNTKNEVESSIELSVFLRSSPRQRFFSLSRENCSGKPAALIPVRSGKKGR